LGCHLGSLSSRSSAAGSTGSGHEQLLNPCVADDLAPVAERSSSTSASPLPCSMPPVVQPPLLHRVGPLLPFLRPWSFLALSWSASTALNFLAGVPRAPNCPANIHLHHIAPRPLPLRRICRLSIHRRGGSAQVVKW
jgi:hypothetical protein